MEKTKNSDILLETVGVKKWFPVRNSIMGKTTSYVKAVDDINLTVRRGETLGIVGESGCGKSTLARVLLGLIKSTDGAVIFDGKDISTLSKAEMRNARRDIQIIFQDPYASLNPRMKVKDILSEPFKIHEKISHKEALKKAEELVDMVGLNRDSLGKYPHEFSGGQRQRICIARAIALRPKMIVCDECVSALDVSIQAQIINLLMSLQEKLGLTLVFISHDLRVVEHISTYMAVMYLGKVVEFAKKEEIFTSPSHPYTKALMSAVPIADPHHQKNRTVLKGDIPSPINMPSGCNFHTRCPVAKEECKTTVPQLKEISPDNFCRCLIVEKENS